MADRMAQLRLSGKQAFIEKLKAAGAVSDEAEACWQLFGSAEEALPFLNTADDGRRGYKSPWQEYYSLKYSRFYYCNDAIGFNSWDMPPPMQLAEWMVDTGLYGVDVTAARDVYSTLRTVLDASWHRAGALWAGVALLHKLVGNVAGCGNTVAKYRMVKLDNPKLREAAFSLPGAEVLLQRAGFSKFAQSLIFPDPPKELAGGADEGARRAHTAKTDEHVRAVRTACMYEAKLQQLSSRKGFTGSAKEVDDTASGSGAGSKHSGKPGFKYQKDIIECSLCAHPINDGTDRLRIKAHDTPRGEFRYECGTCEKFNLCEGCWDRHASGGAQLHDAGHQFRTIHPHESQHGLHAGTSGTDDASNPWGRASGAPAGRALDRLAERHGIRDWL
ncbi:hypothetical protein FOA52_004050 [Chlamydomonas sp. UWO 241]|nr:hypothetical protein FOA52_004050 [Chlamydomonas sp. UWO 241]